MGSLAGRGQLRRHALKRRLFQHGAMHLLGAGSVSSGAFPTPNPIGAAGKNVFLTARRNGGSVAVGVTSAVNDAAARGRSSAVADSEVMHAISFDAAAHCGGVIGWNGEEGNREERIRKRMEIGRKISMRRRSFLTGGK